MKLRCTKNSIRLRLRKSEVKKLEEEGRIREGVQFDLQNAFSFELCIAEIVDLQASFEKGNICVQIPGKMARHWMHTETVGLEASQAVKGGQLHILIEKDFPCKDRPDEDKSDTFQELAQE